MCIFLYIGDSSFLFCFPGYLRLFLYVQALPRYMVFSYIVFFLICIVQEIWYLYIGGSLFLYFAQIWGYFLIYIGISLYIWNITLSVMCFLYIIMPSFSYALPRICVFSYKCFFFLYIQEIDTFSFQVIPQRVFLYIVSIYFLYTLPQYFLYIFFCTLPIFLIYSYFSIGWFLVYME